MKNFLTIILIAVLAVFGYLAYDNYIKPQSIIENPEEEEDEDSNLPSLNAPNYSSGTEESVFASVASTFSGWGGPIGAPEQVRSLRFPIQARDNAITEIQVFLLKNDKAGELIANTILTVNIPAKDYKYIVYKLPERFINTNNDELYFVYQCNQLCNVRLTTQKDATVPLSYVVEGKFKPASQMTQVYAGTPASFLFVTEGNFSDANNNTIEAEVFIPVLNLPSTLYGVQNEEINVYFDNIIENDYNDYNFDVTCSIGRQENERWTATPDTAGTYTFKLSVYDNNDLLIEKNANIVISSATAGTDVTKSLLVIGDSTTASGTTTGELNTIFETDAMDLTLLGTCGTAPNLHEGHSGWTANHFVNSQAVLEVTNPFYNTETSAFDFDYYMTNNSFASVDYVIINLGINDTFSFTSDSTLSTGITTILSYYQTMIDSIKSFNSNIKIGIALTIPPAYNQDAFAASYGNGQTRFRYKRNNLLFVKALTEYFATAQTNVSLIPINTNLDTQNNYPTTTEAVNSQNSTTDTIQSNAVHPAASGYKQIADSIYYWIKSLV